jgi:hypothetical protein
VKHTIRLKRLPELNLKEFLEKTKKPLSYKKQRQAISDRAWKTTNKADKSNLKSDHVEAAKAHFSAAHHHPEADKHEKQALSHVKKAGKAAERDTSLRNIMSGYKESDERQESILPFCPDSHFSLLSEFAHEVNTKAAHEEAYKAAKRCVKIPKEEAIKLAVHHKLAMREAEDLDTLEMAEHVSEAAVCSNGFSLLTQPKKFAGYHDGLTSGEKHKVKSKDEKKQSSQSKQPKPMKEIISLVSGSIQEETIVKGDLIPVQEEPLRVEMGNKENAGKNSNPVPSKTTYSHNYGVAHFASLKAHRTGKPEDHKYAVDMHQRALDSAKSSSDKKYHQEKIADHNKIVGATSESVDEVYRGPASPKRRIASSKAGKAAAMAKYTIDPVVVKPTDPAKGVRG